MLLVPGAICFVMVLAAAAIAAMAAIDPRQLLIPYFFVALATTFISVNIFVFHRVVLLALSGSDNSVPFVWRLIRDRALLLLLPACLWPLFLVSYTAAKVGIPLLVEYRWDAVWAAADRAIFGTDAWQITHRVFGAWSMPFWEWLYTWAWGALLLYVPALLVLYASRRTVSIFFSAMFATWMVGGFLMAYAFSSAGPIYAHLVDAGLRERFQPLLVVLDNSLAPIGVRTTQTWLAEAMHSRIAVKGAGISAMPSMHLGACSIYVLAAWRSKWLAPAILFWAAMFIASAHVGYHYWVDGIVAAGVAFVFWKTAELIYGEQADLASNRSSPESI